MSEDSWIGQLNAAAARAAREPIGATKDATQPTDNPIRHKRYHHFSDGSSPSHSWGWGALLLGDDTWTSLYPNHFDAKASLPMASFDTRDLHTVDEAVSLCLGPLIDVSLAQEDTCSSFPAKNAAPSTPVDTTANAGANTMPPNGKSQPSSEPWAVMIAHFLGVDHGKPRSHSTWNCRSRFFLFLCVVEGEGGFSVYSLVLQMYLYQWATRIGQTTPLWQQNSRRWTKSFEAQ